MKSIYYFCNTSALSLARCYPICTLEIEALVKRQLRQSVKMHLKSGGVNFDRSPYSVYSDLRTATALARSLMNVLNTCEKGRLET